MENLTLILCSELRGEEWKPLLHQVVKWCMASVDLFVQGGRRKPEEENTEHLKNLCSNQRLLTEAEVDVLLGIDENIHRASVLWVWVCHCATQALVQNGTAAPRTSAVAAQCVKARDGIYNMGEYIETPLPYAYVHLISLLVQLQNLVVALKAGVVCSQNFGTAGGNLIVCQEMFMTIVVCTIYQGLLQIS